MSTAGSGFMDKTGSLPPAEIQRLRNQALMGWPKEARTLRWFGLQDGMNVLEIGSGPGFVTEQLLDLFPHSRITALDHNPVMLQKARRYLEDKAGGRLEFVEASAVDTNLPDCTFDFAIARLIFQHLPRPVEVAGEVLRVLKPGGKLAVIDVDDGIYGLTDPPIPEFDNVLCKLAQAQARRGGDRCVGHRLWRILEEAGFTGLDLEAVIKHSDELGLDAFRSQLNIQRLEPFVKSGVLTQPEFAALTAGANHFWSSPDAYAMMVYLMVCGMRPE